MKLDYAPRGWNSWDCYGAAVDEATVRANAKYMADHLLESGYEYIVVDIQWYEPNAKNNEYRNFATPCMDRYGRVIPAENRFPSSKDGMGFIELGKYIHELGLKFGIHIMRGIPRAAVHQDLPILGTKYTARDVAKTNSICSWNTDMYGVDPTKPGAKEYYDSIFTLYASWGVDFVKIDDICRELPHEEEELKLMADCLHNCGRDMVLSLSPGPALLEKAELYKQIANMWRITDDFWDDYKLLYNMFERAEKWSIHAGNGHFPDADMLPLGAIRQVYDPNATTKFTRNEQTTMMVLWSIMRSPLILGCELTKLDRFTSNLITSKGLMDMHKNSRHAHQVLRCNVGQNEIVLWTAIRSEGGQYIAIFNLDGPDCSIEIGLDEFELEGSHDAQDLITGRQITWNNKINTRIEKHGVACYVVE